MPVFADNFTDTDATQLQSHTPDTGTGWTRLWSDDAALDFVITTNRANPENNVNSGVIYTADATYPSADYDLTLTGVGFYGAADGPLYLFVRLQDQENLYAVKVHGNAQGAVSRLYKKVTGTWTALGTAFTGPADGSVIKLEIIGSTLKFYDDGVEQASATDTDISAAGKAGLGAGGAAELVTSTDDARAGNIVDSLTVNDLGGAPPEGQPTMRRWAHVPGVRVGR